MRDHTMAIRRYFFDVLSEDDLERLHSVSLQVLEAIDPEVCEILETDRTGTAG
jgi:hypothetical protein